MSTIPMPATFWNPSLHGHGASQHQQGHDRSQSSYVSRSSSSSALPISPHRRQILYSVEHCGVVVVIGAPGTGKSTQIPRYLAEAGWASQGFSVVCTQPQQAKAVALSQQIASTLCGSGGYADATNESIQYVTDDALLRQVMLDPLLSRYSAVVIDDVHERSVPTDALLGILKRLRHKQRHDLRLIVTSATAISAASVLEFLVGKVPSVSAISELMSLPLHRRGTIISVGGKPNPVDVLYLENPTPDYVVAAIEAIWSIYNQTTCSSQSRHLDDGDVLCFLPTVDDIHRAIRLAEEHFDRQETISPVASVDFLPLFESLPHRMQSQVLLKETAAEDKTHQNSEHRRLRVIFANHWAETSVTVPHVRYVVDSGLTRLSYFDPEMGLDRFVTGPTSLEAAQQRTSLAGFRRQGVGACYRLYSETYLGNMASHTPPAIHRTNLTSFLLTLKAVGVDNILGFEIIDTPNLLAIRHGLESLYALGAIDEQTRLTKMGLNMTTFPVDPRISRMMLQSLTEGCAWEVLAVASALHVSEDLIHQPRHNSKGTSIRQQQILDYEESMAAIIDSSGDHVTFANLFSASDDHGGWTAAECKEKFINYNALRRGLEMRKQLGRLLAKFGKVSALGLSDEGGEVERGKAIRRCVTAGYFASTAKLASDGTYYSMRKRVQVSPSPASIIARHAHISSEYVVFGETADGQGDTIELRFVSAVEAKWLRELAPHYWE